MTSVAAIGLLGGTLDPIHVGHIETASAAARAFGLDRVYVLPSNVPPHRAARPLASGYHRFAMAALAINGLDGFEASDLELCAPGPSYTADTLERFRERGRAKDSEIFFITGADAFAEIETWHRYPEVLDLAHFAVVSRPRYPVEMLRRVLPSLATRMVSVNANREPNREPRTANCEPAIFLVDAVTPDVSSTDIRRRLAAGESISGMVPAAVEQHLRQHRLYSRPSDHSTADHLHGQD
jgi:nicotinate-nucleotide adenylyltransferase